MKVLFGVSDWGLGHATRDIPLIEALLKEGNEVHIVSTGRPLILLREYFGKKCIYWDIPAAEAPYPKGKYLITKFAISIPKMCKEMLFSRMKIRRLIKRKKYDKIISDCRFDVYHKKSNSILINHQLWLEKPFYTLPVNLYLVTNAHKNFGKIIVPDYPGSILTGEFSSSTKYIIPIHYIGVISHLKKSKIKQDIDYFITISGPEPQRTLFEEKILEQVNNLKGKVVIAGGRPEDKSKVKLKNVHFYGFLNTKEQENMMNRAKFIISRPGYTTLMDIVELDKKKALFVPTPGQPEQEYIADLYEQKKWFHHVHQDEINLLEDIKKCKGFKGYRAKWKTNSSVKKFINLIKK